MSTCAIFLSISALSNIPVYGFTCTCLSIPACLPQDENTCQSLIWKSFCSPTASRNPPSEVLYDSYAGLHRSCLFFSADDSNSNSCQGWVPASSTHTSTSNQGYWQNCLRHIDKIHFKAFGIQGLTKTVAVQCLSRARRASPGDLVSLSVPTSGI